MTSPKGITVQISTAEWINPAIERIAKMGEDLMELGVPRGVAHDLCKSSALQLAAAATKVHVPGVGYAGKSSEEWEKLRLHRDGAPLEVAAQTEPGTERRG